LNSQQGVVLRIEDWWVLTTPHNPKISMLLLQCQILSWNLQDYAEQEGMAKGYKICNLKHQKSLQERFTGLLKLIIILQKLICK